MQEFGIIVFGHTRATIIGDLLESLDLQNAIQFVDLWIDGHQGNPDLKNKVAVTQRVCNRFDVRSRRYHNGQLGFRKMMLQAMQYAVRTYKDVLFLEDDCFPTRKAVDVFRQELDIVRDDPNIFSVYGHHFGMAEDSGVCTRFQGWGWATTAEKLAPYVTQLIDCYSMSEWDFIRFTKKSLTGKIRKALDTTPPRNPTDTLERFFAWDETLALLTALNGIYHKPTHTRVIYNCGVGDQSGHFRNLAQFTAPPFNLIRPEDVWDVFE